MAQHHDGPMGTYASANRIQLLVWLGFKKGENAGRGFECSNLQCLAAAVVA